MAKRYIGLDTYNCGVISNIIENNLCDGLILGDLFCENRMFKYGNNELIRYFDEISKTKLDIIYQMPYYLTSRNDRQVNNNLRLLYDLKPNSAIMVSDVGFANKIKKIFPDFKLAWSSMQRGRISRINDYTYKFLKQLGIDYVEAMDSDKAEIIRANNLIPWMVWGFTEYKTFGRVCYMQQQLGERLPDCRNLCINSFYSLKDSKSDYNMTIDGYMLGRRLSYGNHLFKENDIICIYAKSYDELIKLMGEIKYEKI